MLYLNKPLFIALLAFLVACSSKKGIEQNSSANAGRQNYGKIIYPSSIENACDILDAHPSWRDAFSETYSKYGVPPHLIMAFIHQESRFKHNARAKTSTAFGYPQAKTATWNWYLGKTSQRGKVRTSLPDAVDFIGWYVVENTKRTNLSKWESGEQYLGYHEGTGGYLRSSHLSKGWLLEVAKKVDRRARNYRQQLNNCFSFPKA